MTASKDESRTVAQRLEADPFRKCNQSSSEKLGQLERLLAEELQTGYASDAASLVVFGSLARRGVDKRQRSRLDISDGRRSQLGSLNYQGSRNSSTIGCSHYEHRILEDFYA